MARWLLIALLCCGSAQAQVDSSTSSLWAELSPEQRSLLTAWSERWNALDPEQRERLKSNARAWLDLPPEERERLRKRMEQWDSLPPMQRAQLRQRYEIFRQLPPEERRRLREGFQRFQSLPAEERERRREEFARMTPSERRTFLVGSQGKEIADVARRAFTYVPLEERPATWLMLRELSVEERRLLREAARRLSPAMREQLRRELIDTPAGERSAQLRRRLGSR